VARGLVRLTRGEIDGAVQDLEQALHLCRTAEIRLLFPHTARYLGRAYTLIGRNEDARLLLEEAIGQSSALAAGRPAGLVRFGRSLGRTWRGRIPRGRGVGDIDARPVAPARLPAGRGPGIAPAGGNRVGRGNPDLQSSEQYCRQALELAKSLEMLPEVAHCQRDLALLLARMTFASKARHAAVRGHRALQVDGHGVVRSATRRCARSGIVEA